MTEVMYALNNSKFLLNNLVYMRLSSPGGDGSLMHIYTASMVNAQ